MTSGRPFRNTKTGEIVYLDVTDDRRRRSHWVRVYK